MKTVRPIENNNNKDKTYLIFHVVGYEQKDQFGNLEDKVVIRLIDTTYESALNRAKKIVDKPFWLLGEVVEYYKEVK
jgi:hypothetical protein